MEKSSTKQTNKISITLISLNINSFFLRLSTFRFTLIALQVEQKKTFSLIWYIFSFYTRCAWMSCWSMLFVALIKQINLLSIWRKIYRYIFVKTHPKLIHHKSIGTKWNVWQSWQMAFMCVSECVPSFFCNKIDRFICFLFVNFSVLFKQKRNFFSSVETKVC